MDPVDRLRTAGKLMTDPLELRAQILAEHVIDLVVHSLDMNYLVRQVDLNAVIAQVDLNELLAQVDVNAIVRRVDIDALVEQTDIGAVIARSSGGVASDALDALRSQAVGLDEFIARWVARLRRRPLHRGTGPSRTAARPGSVMSTARQRAPVTPPPAAQEVLQRHYAGAVSRFAAFAVDVGVSTGIFLAALGGLAFAISIVTRHSVSWSKDNIVVGIIFLAWLFTYYAHSWGAAGKTAGMALLGVRVVASDGTEAGPRRGVERTLAFPLSFLFLGLGFLGILVQRDRRALHDLIAGTVVIYDWDARAARLRFLARESRTDPADPAQGPFTQPG